MNKKQRLKRIFAGTLVKWNDFQRSKYDKEIDKIAHIVADRIKEEYARLGALRKGMGKEICDQRFLDPHNGYDHGKTISTSRFWANEDHYTSFNRLDSISEKELGRIILDRAKELLTDDILKDLDIQPRHTYFHAPIRHGELAVYECSIVFYFSLEGTEHKLRRELAAIAAHEDAELAKDNWKYDVC